MWVEWLLALILSVIFFYAFIVRYKQIDLQRNAYIQSQLVGLLIGLLIHFFPESKLLIMLFWIIWVLFKYINLWNKEFFVYLSKD